MTNERTLSAPGQLIADVIAVAVVSLALLFGGTQSGMVTPTLTWVSGVLVLGGLCLGFLFWRYSLGNEQGVFRPRLSGFPLALFLIGILSFGILWLGFGPSRYDGDLVYGVLALVWTAFGLSYAG
ncbi:hypothetical protein [Natronolimnohabitans innermongolicus]|uniref:Uncharacterized protein n=1 Tax=Natronolimnohabitans innermongolicus JCM 12255 TaxID=1227499 RepID=L9WH35_9EURY|nr:hypothetical protein [Natronolimnohabitans innermongolicus]ELY48764.1 hypothetical protein C493_21801 [Natronolimnohabitans innermongolicus JCM 12255]